MGCLISKSDSSSKKSESNSFWGLFSKKSKSNSFWGLFSKKSKSDETDTLYTQLHPSPTTGRHASFIEYINPIRHTGEETRPLIRK